MLGQVFKTHTSWIEQHGSQWCVASPLPPPVQQAPVVEYYDLKLPKLHVLPWQWRELTIPDEEQKLLTFVTFAAHCQLVREIMLQYSLIFAVINFVFLFYGCEWK